MFFSKNKAQKVQNSPLYSLNKCKKSLVLRDFLIIEPFEGDKPSRERARAERSD